MLAALFFITNLFTSTPAPIPEFVVKPADKIGVEQLDLVIQLNVINDYVNEHCQFTDQGPDNPWGRCGLKGWKGNCKDFALEKRAELLISGLDPKRLRIWYVLVPDQGHIFGHAVLVVDNTWVLDNRFNLVTHRGFQESRGYEFICPISDKNLYDGKSHTDDPHRCKG